MTDADIERAVTDGKILRTHVLRPTWHFVAAEDIVWMLELTAPRIHVSMRSFMRHQGLETKTMTRAIALFERALSGGRCETRAELASRLARAGIPLTAPQMMGVAMYAELERIICSGPRRGKESTYALVTERAPAALRLPRDEALSLLATRFFASHGPATVKDFVWWSGLGVTDARRGIEIARLPGREVEGLTYWGGQRTSRAPGGTGVHLLPIYDEYLVSYRDRLAVPHGPGRIRVGARTVGFRHALLVDGQVAGTWNVARERTATRLVVTPIRPLSRLDRSRLDAVIARYTRFLGSELQPAIDRRGDPI